MADQQLAADSASNGYCLDVLLFFGEFDTWPVEFGGFFSYIAVEDPNEVKSFRCLIKLLILILDFESTATAKLLGNCL